MDESQKSSTEALYRIAVNGADLGPYTAEQMHCMVSNGQITPETPVWTEGMSEWTPYCVLFPAPACPPPFPPPAPPMKDKRNVLVAVGIVALLICGVCLYSWHKDSGAEKDFDKGAYYLFSGEERIAKPYIKSAAEAGNMNAMYLYAYLLNDKSEAMEWYEKAAQKGQLEAMFKVCEAYFYGKGVRADKEKALKLAIKIYKRGVFPRDAVDIFSQAIKELDIPTAIVSVLKSGNVGRINKKTITKIKNLANKGDGWAQFIYAEWVKETEEDMNEAEDYLLKAASKGMVLAKYMLVELYKKNDRKKEALKLMREMCDNGEADRDILREVYTMDKAD